MIYVHKHYPKVKYHRTLTPVTVATKEHEERLGDEWADSPAAFQQEKEPTSREEGLAQADAHVHAQDGALDPCAAEEVVADALDKLEDPQEKDAPKPRKRAPRGKK